MILSIKKSLIDGIKIKTLPRRINVDMSGSKRCFYFHHPKPQSQSLQRQYYTNRISSWYLQHSFVSQQHQHQHQHNQQRCVCTTLTPSKGLTTSSTNMDSIVPIASSAIFSSSWRSVHPTTSSDCFEQRPTFRSFASDSSSHQSKQQQHRKQPQQQQNNNKNKAKPSEAGRIVLHQNNLKKLKPGQVKLCNGCGTEVRRASSKSNDQISAHQIIAGVDANKDIELSKKQAKKARFAEATSMDKGAFLCDRCRALQSENIYRAYDALADVSPEVFSNQLQHIVGRRRYGLCIVVVDSTDPEHSAVKHLRRSIGQKTPIWLVINKVDLVPKMDHRTCRLLSHRIASIMGVGVFQNYFPVSSITGRGIYELAERLLSSLGGKDVFIVGCANVGKSTLVHRLAGVISTASYLKGKRGQARRDVCNNLAVTGSHLPGTTLQAVRIPCFSSDRHALWDTPGIINRKAIQYSLFPVHLMEPMARPEIIPIPSKEAGTQGHWQNGYSVLIEAAWMDGEVDENATTEENSETVNSNDSIGEKVLKVQQQNASIDNIVVSDDESDEDNTNDDKNDEDHDDENINMEKHITETEVDEVTKHEGNTSPYDHATDDGDNNDDEDDDSNIRDEDEDDNVDDIAANEYNSTLSAKDKALSIVAREYGDDDFDPDDDFETKKRKAAKAKKMAILQAAKERRKLREQQSSNDSGTVKGQKDTKVAAYSNNKSKSKDSASQPTVARGPCVLGRIDLVNVENGGSVFAQAYLHPSLRIRIVPTSEAPDHATIPTNYLNEIRSKMEQAAGRNNNVATNLKAHYSIPLKPFIQNQANGEVVPGDKEYSESFDSYYMDIVFASLGWIAISHRGKFTVIPHCVDGSVYSKRPSLYPTNLASRVTSPDLEDDSPFNGLNEEEVLDRLRSAAKQGRHATGGTGSESNNYQERQHQYGGRSVVNDSEMYHFEDSYNSLEEDSQWY
jgi:hypothetical protein